MSQPPSITLRLGDSRQVLAEYPGDHFDSVVCDPPYELAFMGREWDKQGVAFEVAFWAEVLRVLKPGGHLIAFGGTRTYHRMTCAIEDAGFEIRDSLHWLYGTGFPKSLNVSKAIDKSAGAEREVVGVRPSYRPNTQASRDPKGFQDRSDGNITAPATEAAKKWEGWGTALKPAHEPIVLARKPLAEKSVAANVLAHGTGAINVDACRVPLGDEPRPQGSGDRRNGTKYAQDEWTRTKMHNGGNVTPDAGRFPANVLHDGSDEVMEAFATFGPTSATGKRSEQSREAVVEGTAWGTNNHKSREYPNELPGTAARFFYCAKASKSERGADNTHPTVKPLALMRWLVRLVTPPSGTILDPFLGSGTTALACREEGFGCVGIEACPEYLTIAESRVRPTQAA